MRTAKIEPDLRLMSALKILLLVNSFILISVDVNKPFQDIVLRDDPNESSAVYLLSSDDKCAVCGTNFSEIFSDVSSHL